MSLQAPTPVRQVKSLWRDYKRRRIKKGLTRAYERCREQEQLIDTGREPVVIFSDHHKGDRSHADDFWRCEAAYNAALGYYLESGFRLVVLGDVEELWEATPSRVLHEYEDTLRLEGEFLGRDRYERVWGNHDPDWADEEAVSKLLAQALGQRREGFRVREALCLGVSIGGRRLGQLFVVHGHQGTLDSDVLAIGSKPLVRYAWAPVQRWLRRPWNTPARDHVLRAEHDRAMFEWAEARPESPVLIAGHTHRPVFWARERPEPDLAALEEELRKLREQGAPNEDIATQRAKLEAARARHQTTPDLAPVKMKLPCYFNTGCASFGDGSITGLELVGDAIQLVRWPWPYGEQPPSPQLLDTTSLSAVFTALAKGSPGPD